MLLAHTTYCSYLVTTIILIIGGQMTLNALRLPPYDTTLRGSSRQASMQVPFPFEKLPAGSIDLLHLRGLWAPPWLPPPLRFVS